MLTAAYNETEVLSALNSIAPSKAPGPDSMLALLFQKIWGIVGTDVSGLVLNFLNNWTIPDGLNHTNIILIPKVKEAKNMMQFRPISLCNVVYKIASKMVANRLKQVLPDIISESHSAFVPGRLITENVITAFEINLFLRRKTVKEERSLLSQNWYE